MAVMALPPGVEMGHEVVTDADQVLIVVEGDGEASVGDLDLGVEPGDLAAMAQAATKGW
jgi:mannose-6-phosphate isomerase-like protein (cupin superfamily)